MRNTRLHFVDFYQSRPNTKKEFEMEKIDIAKLDPAMALKPTDTEGICWHLPYEKPMVLLGFNWFDVDGKYERLPLTGRPETVTRFPDGEKTIIPASECGALQLSHYTAGGQVRFRTDSSKIMIHAELLETGGMDHMAFTGSAGFDIYRKCAAGWKFFGVTRTDHSQTAFTTVLSDGVDRTSVRDVIIHFPLYNGVKSLAIGLEENAVLEAPTPFADARPIVFYGTSITQGGCATRPGMCSSNLMSRMLDRYVINLGFSGNGRGEPEIAEMLADISDPALYILDYCWNVNHKELQATLSNVIDTIRKKHPTTPLLLVAPTPGQNYLPEIHWKNEFAEKRDTMREEVEKRRLAGDKNFFFFNATDDALGNDFLECTVDGTHLTDLGFLRFSEAICPIIKEILG